MAPSTPTGNPAAPAVGSGCSSGNRPRDTIHRCEASHGMKATALHSDKYLESRAALSLQADGVKQPIRCNVRRCEAMKRTPIGGASCASYRRRHQPVFFGKLARRVRTGDTTPFVRTRPKHFHTNTPGSSGVAVSREEGGDGTSRPLQAVPQLLVMSTLVNLRAKVSSRRRLGLARSSRP